MDIKYKQLNEGRYTNLYDFTNLSSLESLYFELSPTTIVIRRLLKALDLYMKEDLTKKSRCKILDVGCGGGIKDLTLRGDVTGIDISESSAKNARKIYKTVVLGDLSKKYPFADETFDVVYCSEVYGHIADKDKEHFLSEVRRVLKKDGAYFFSCETKGENWLTKHLKEIGKYQSLWIDHDGHIGLETPSKTIKRFKTKFSTAMYKINNTYVFTIDELLTIFPWFSIIFFNETVRRIGNIFLLPFYFASLRFCSLRSANNIIIYGKK
jgi:SAM-dependent methyltransferase